MHGSPPPMYGSNVTSPRGDTPSINASYCGRASILQGRPLYGRAAVSIRLIIDASSGSSGCVTRTLSVPFEVLISRSFRSSTNPDCGHGRQFGVHRKMHDLKECSRGEAGDISPMVKIRTIFGDRSYG